MKILLVDDLKKNREAGMADLTAIGHEVVAFSGYAKAAVAITESRFDAALLDLLMPAEAMMLGSKGLEHLGQEIPAGLGLSMFAADRGVPLVAVATDMNHHDHPASAMLDWFHNRKMRINDSLVLWMHSPMKAEGIKDWGKVLKQLESG